VAACRALCEWAFKHLDLVTILLQIDVDNEPSKRVARALGALPAPGPGPIEVDRVGIPRQLVTYTLAS
jgi:hypothetical protein